MKCLFCLFSVLTFGAEWDQPRPGVPKGSIEDVSLASKIYGRSRPISVYTPAGYSKSNGQPYDLIVCFDGADYKTELALPIILDNLLDQHRIRPTVAVMVDTSERRLQDLANHEEFARFMSEELIPFVRGRWNVTKDPHRVTVAGYSAGGLAAAFVAFRHPEVFGKVLSQSGAFWRGPEGQSTPYEWLTSQFAQKGKLDLRFYVEVGAKETGKAVGVGPVFIEANRRFRDALLAKGYPVDYVEMPGAAHEPNHWRSQLAPGILSLAGTASE